MPLKITCLFTTQECLGLVWADFGVISAQCVGQMKAGSEIPGANRKCNKNRGQV